jgi:hypothetical protein
MSLNSLEIDATFDGEVFRPTQPVRLKPDTPVHLVVRTHAVVTDVGVDAQARHEALLRLAGTWTKKDAEEFYAATEWTRRIEPEDWK